MKPLYKYLIVFSALIAGYLLFGAGAWLMPDRAVQRHVRETLDKGDMESDQPRAVLPHMMQTRMDNFTDAIILNQAYVMRLEGFRTGVLSVPRWWGPLLPYEVLRAGVDGQEKRIVLALDGDHRGCRHAVEHAVLGVVDRAPQGRQRDAGDDLREKIDGTEELRL